MHIMDKANLMNSYRLGLYEKAMPNTLTLSEKLLTTKLSEFDFLELSIDETDEKLARLDWEDKQIESLKQLMEHHQVFIQSICLSGHRRFPLGSETDDIREKALSIMIKAISLAYRLGIRYIQIAGYDEYYKPSNQKTKALFLEGLKKSVHVAATYGVVLGFETMETEFMNTVEKAMHYVNAIKSPYLGVYPDIGNLTNAQEGQGSLVVKDLMKGEGHLIAAHLKETKPNIFRNLTFGEGHTNYPLLLNELARQGVHLFVGEFWYNGEEDWQHNINQAAKFLREKIEGVM